MFTQYTSSSHFKTGTRQSWWREWDQEYSSLIIALCWWAALSADSVQFAAADWGKYNSLFLSLSLSLSLRKKIINWQDRLASFLAFVSFRKVLLITFLFKSIRDKQDQCTQHYFKNLSLTLLMGAERGWCTFQKLSHTFFFHVKTWCLPPCFSLRFRSRPN